MSARAFTLLVALWSVVGPSLAAATASEGVVESCCGTAAAACCCCDEPVEADGHGARSERGCPCTAPVEPGAPASIPALPAPVDQRVGLDAPALSACAPTITAAPASTLAPARRLGLPPPRAVTPNVLCVFLL